MVSGAQAASYNNQNTPKKARPTYNYAGIKYTSQNIDLENEEEDCTQDGINVNGSFDVNGQVFVQGAFGDVSGAHLNPAVTVARAFTQTFPGIRPLDVCGFMLAQCIGALGALGVARLLRAR